VGSRGDRRIGDWSRSERIAAISSAAAVGGVLLGVLTWLWPSGASTEDPRTTASESAQPGTAAPSRPATSPPGTGAATAQRYLAELAPLEGAGAVRVVPPYGLDMPCGTNQSDDKLREVVYRLPGNYRQVVVEATPTGKADRESLTELSIYVHDRYDRADRERQAALRTVPLGTTVRLQAEISGARTLTIRIRCQSPSVAVRFADPRITA